MAMKKTCPHCEKKRKDDLQQEEFNFAVLLSLIPLIVFVLFGQIGLF